MILPLSILYAAGTLAVPKLSAQESAAFIMLAASILVFRTFRERFLLIWILGWLAYGLSLWFGVDSAAFTTSPELQAVSQAAFVLAVSLFAASILIYTHFREIHFHAAHDHRFDHDVLGRAGTVLADEVVARVPLEIAYRLLAIAAAVQLLRYRWGRFEIGPWLMACGFFFLHLDWAGVTGNVPTGVF